MHEGIIIQARTGSSRLHNKILLPFCGTRRIIDILIDNIKKDNPGKRIVLATTDRPQDDVLENVACEAGVDCFRGDEKNVLDRFIRAAETFGLERFVRVCSDNPLLQTGSFQRLFDEHDARPADYVAFGFRNGLPTIKSHLGLFAELTTLEALRKVAATTDDPLFLEHVTIYLYTHPQDFSIRLLPLPCELEERFDLRFTLDTAEDFALLKDIYEAYANLPEKTPGNLVELVSSKHEWKETMLGNIKKNAK